MSFLRVCIIEIVSHRNDSRTFQTRKFAKRSCSARVFWGEGRDLGANERKTVGLHSPVIVDETRLQSVAVECRRDEGAGYGEDIHVTSWRGRWRRQRRRRRRPLNLLHVREPSSCTTAATASSTSTTTSSSSSTSSSSPAAPTPFLDAGSSRGGRDVRRTIERPPI